MEMSLPPPLAGTVAQALEEWRRDDKTRRLWRGDSALWTGRDESRWLGWLRATEDRGRRLGELKSFAAEIHGGGVRHALLLGMGGSSLAPEVLARTFGSQPGHPQLFVLDSTDPDQVAAFESRIDAQRTLVVVSSKSGSTLEPDILRQYFFQRLSDSLGVEAAAKRFVAVTDPGSRLEEVAARDGFRRVFHGVPSIGGRYSALSDFGMVPAAILGLDLDRLLDRAHAMAAACGPAAASESNPGVRLGALLGAAGRTGRDKVTFIASPGVAALGAWLEQLLAESTGKEGQALIPVDGEPAAAPELYGDDRLFVYLRLEPEPAPAQEEAVARLEAAGHPVVRVALSGPYDLGAEFFRWELATAVAGSILGINPFDQPDVEASKVASRALTDAYEASGALPPEEPFVREHGLALFADRANRGALGGDGASLEQCLRAHLERLRPGDYFAILAWVEMCAGHDREIQALRRRVRDARGVATCVGYGPRFLHSTGQAYKGGPATGVFLQITADGRKDVPVPGRGYTFGVVKAAQARGDLAVLEERGRRVLRVHLGTDALAGLRTLRRLLERALEGPARSDG